jgi:hypothetical protein
VLERGLRLADERLAARHVEVEERVLRVGVEDLEPASDHLGVVAGLVPRAERRPDLPARRVVRLSGRPADRDDRRPGLLGERGAVHARADEHQSPLRRVPPLAVQLEHGVPAQDDVELLVRVLVLRVLVDHAVARVGRRPGVDAEAGDAEVVPDRPHRDAPVVELRDVVDARDRVTVH